MATTALRPAFWLAVLWVTCLLPHTKPLNAANILHVAVSGDDTSAGTETAPLATIQAAVNRANAGDTIRIGNGVFYEQIVIRKAGTADAPITLEGTRSAEGQRLSRIALGQAVDPQTWEPAADVGPGVFANRSFGFEPGLLTVNGLYVAHVHRNNWRLRTGNEHGEGRPMRILAWPEDHIEPTTSQHRVPIPFWQTMGGVYTYLTGEDENITYLRLADGVDPREQTVEISPGGAVVHIDGGSHIILRGLEITNGEIGVQVSGATAQHNLIEDCYISHGRVRVMINSRASHTTVRDCHIAMAFIGTRPGAWGGPNVESGKREFIYNFFKQIQSPSASSDDRAIRVQNGARDTVIEGNHLDAGLVAITSSGIKGLIVRDNVIHDFSSVGLSIITGSIDAHFHDNLIYNCNKNIRLHRLNQGNGHRVYIYRNRLFQPEGVGEHIYTHSHTEEQLELMEIEEYDEPEITVYHNTFIGGSNFMSLTTRMRYGVPGFRFINNVISSGQTFRWFREDSIIGAFDYNWINDPAAKPHSGSLWFGEHNILATGKSPWPTDRLPNFKLPENSTARQAGIDVSQPFVIDGWLYQPLPGMEPGYFYGERPDIGAIQMPTDG